MITYGTPFEEYQGIEAVSNTMLGVLNQPAGPAKLRHWLDTDEEEETDALRLGRLAHLAVLEPTRFIDAFHRSYAIKPDGMKFSTTEGKQWKGERELEGKTIVTQAEAKFLYGVVPKIEAHETARRMLKAGKSEVSVSAMMADSPVKARLDFLTDGNCIVDVKTCADASPEGFEKAIEAHSYHRQAAFYLDVCKLAGIERTHFTFLAIEKTPPYCVATYRVEDYAIEYGRQEYQRLMALYRHCVKENSWDGYSGELQPIGLPAWKMKQLEAA